jgi:hypothetical protein
MEHERGSFRGRVGGGGGSGGGGGLGEGATNTTESNPSAEEEQRHPRALNPVRTAEFEAHLAALHAAREDPQDSVWATVDSTLLQIRDDPSRDRDWNNFLHNKSEVLKGRFVIRSSQFKNGFKVEGG